MVRARGTWHVVTCGTWFRVACARRVCVVWVCVWMLPACALEGGEVGDACDPKEVEVVWREALLPAIVDDALENGRARRDADARPDEHRGIVLEDVL